jgi:predicted negative regulator of RcsB-dependent stress response
VLRRIVALLVLVGLAVGAYLAFRAYQDDQDRQTADSALVDLVVIPLTDRPLSGFQARLTSSSQSSLK